MLLDFSAKPEKVKASPWKPLGWTLLISASLVTTWWVGKRVWPKSAIERRSEERQECTREARDLSDGAIRQIDVYACLVQRFHWEVDEAQSAAEDES